MKNGLYSIIEAEDFKFFNGFQSKSGGFASDGKYVQHSSGSTGSISTDITGRAGTYDIAVHYFDETDGQSEVTFKVDGAVEDRWTWDQNLGSASANADTAATHIIRNVELDSNAQITIEGRGDGDEPMRIDAIELMPQNGGARPAAAVQRADAAVQRVDVASKAKAFEGAEGFGAVTDGGRGGEIVKVTNLNDSGKGSLRWALEDLDMPRIVVFEVGGRINLRDEIKVKGDVTVAGQTAPGDGITVTGARLRVIEDDAIIRGLKIRPGDTEINDKNSRDAISIGYGSETVERVVIDSNSLSWATDEVAVVWFGASDITFSNNIIAEGLASGSASYGMLLGDGSQRITVVDNLFANNFHRNPQLLDVQEIEFVNNVVSNYGNNGFEAPVGGGDHVTAHIIGNHFLSGRDSSSVEPVRLRGETKDTAYFLRDNLSDDHRSRDGMPETAVSEGSGESKIRSKFVFETSGVQASDSGEVLKDVLGSVGARAQGLDDTDRRIVSEVENGGGRVISNPDQVGGYDTRRVTNALSDRDGDGIPDRYEPVIGTNPNRFDAHGDVDRDGYTNIEDYINGLIDGFGAPRPTREIAPEPVVPDKTPDRGGSGRDDAEDVRVQAEAFDLISNFSIERNPHAEGGRFIRADGNGESRAEFEFDGADGIYDIEIAYADEIDGESRLALEVDGRNVASWEFDESLGSRYVTERTMTERTVQNVRIEEGDTLTLIGQADGNEPLRIDSIDYFLV